MFLVNYKPTNCNLQSSMKKVTGGDVGAVVGLLVMNDSDLRCQYEIPQPKRSSYLHSISIYWNKRSFSGYLNKLLVQFSTRELTMMFTCTYNRDGL